MIRVLAPALEPGEALRRLTRGERPFLLDGACDADGLGGLSWAGCDPDDGLVWSRGDAGDPLALLGAAQRRWNAGPIDDYLAVRRRLGELRRRRRRARARLRPAALARASTSSACPTSTSRAIARCGGATTAAASATCSRSTARRRSRCSIASGARRRPCPRRRSARRAGRRATTSIDGASGACSSICARATATR